jgi:hypothetical protein
MRAIWYDPKVNDEPGPSQNRTMTVDLQQALFAWPAYLRRNRRIFGSGMNALAVTDSLWMK